MLVMFDEAKNYNWNNCIGIIEYTEGKWKGFRYEGEFLNGLHAWKRFGFISIWWKI